MFGKCIHCKKSIKIYQKIDGKWVSLKGNYINSHLIGEGPDGGCTSFHDKIKTKQLPAWSFVPIGCVERVYRKEEVKSSSRTCATGTETSTVSTSKISNWFRPSVQGKQPVTVLSTSVQDEQVNLALMDRLPFAAVSTAQMSSFANTAGRVGYKQGYQNGVRDGRRQKDIVVNLDTAIVEYAEIKLADRRVVGDLVRTKVTDMQVRMKQCLANLRELNVRLSGTTDIWTEFGRPFISLTLSFVLAGSRQSFVLSLMPMETMSKGNEGFAVALHAIIKHWNIEESLDYISADRGPDVKKAFSCQPLLQKYKYISCLAHFLNNVVQNAMGKKKNINASNWSESQKTSATGIKKKKKKCYPDCCNKTCKRFCAYCRSND